jgi:AcrR family transcriptional regulator
MKGKKKQEWVEKGYQMISDHGFTNVNVESIARLLNKNKSSFYYYFGNWDVFEEALLEYHLDLAKQFAEEVARCQSIIPDMVHLFIRHQTDIFFHKQLRINRTKPHFKKCFEKVFNLFEQAVHDQWVAFLNLEKQSFLAAKILILISENFLLQITHENFEYDWLENYLLQTAQLMQDMNKP